LYLVGIWLDSNRNNVNVIVKLTWHDDVAR